MCPDWPVLRIPPPVRHVYFRRSRDDQLQLTSVENRQKPGVDHFVKAADQGLGLSRHPAL